MNFCSAHQTPVDGCATCGPIYDRVPAIRAVLHYANCRCSVCKRIDTCRPSFDYYGNIGEPLTCEACFRQSLLNRGIRVDYK